MKPYPALQSTHSELEQLEKVYALYRQFKEFQENTSSMLWGDLDMIALQKVREYVRCVCVCVCVCVFVCKYLCTSACLCSVLHVCTHVSRMFQFFNTHVTINIIRVKTYHRIKYNLVFHYIINGTRLIAIYFYDFLF